MFDTTDGASLSVVLRADTLLGMALSLLIGLSTFLFLYGAVCLVFLFGRVSLLLSRYPCQSTTNWLVLCTYILVLIAV